MAGTHHPIQRVTVVGAGLIGSSWAALFLKHGLDVVVTDLDALQRAEAFYTLVGKVPVRIVRETYGHIANRLQAAVFREAIHLLDSGIASVEAIDAALNEGPGLRWAFMGPFLAFHMGGGAGGIEGFWKMFTPMQRKFFAELGQPMLDDAQIARVSRAVQDAYGQAPSPDLVAARDAFLRQVIAVKSTSRDAGGSSDKED